MVVVRCETRAPATDVPMRGARRDRPRLTSGRGEAGRGHRDGHRGGGLLARVQLGHQLASLRLGDREDPLEQRQGDGDGGEGGEDADGDGEGLHGGAPGRWRHRCDVDVATVPPHPLRGPLRG
jgi:hypothetical protein